MLNNEGKQRTFDQFMQLFILPEIEQRKKSGIIPERFVLTQAQVIFFGDGSSLSAAKKFGPQYRNDIPDIRLKFLQRRISEQSWVTPVKEIIENEYILSANAYNPNIGREEVKHRQPKEILREIGEGEKVLSRQMDKIKKFIK